MSKQWFPFWVSLWFCSSVSGGTPLDIEVDCAKFRISEQATQFEIYISVPRDGLKFVMDGEDLLWSFRCKVSIAQNDSEVVRHEWAAHSIAADSSAIKSGQSLYTQAAFQLPVGIYDVEVIVNDFNEPSVSDSESIAIEVRAFAEQRLQLSDLELSSQIRRDTTRSMFYKNNYTVIPNPGATYGLHRPMLFSYCEIYNLSFPSDDKYQVQYQIMNAAGEVVKEMPSRTKPIRGRQLVEVSGINVVSFPPGDYLLELTVTDLAKNVKAVSKSDFHIHAPVQTIEREQSIAKKFGLITELPERYKHKTEKVGWSRTRSDVSSKYGRPDDIERFPSTSQNRPYEIWSYFNLEGGAQFIFINMNEAEGYRLVHSTARNEISDQNWRRWLTPGARSSSSNSNVNSTP